MYMLQLCAILFTLELDYGGNRFKKIFNNKKVVICLEIIKISKLY